MFRYISIFTTAVTPILFACGPESAVDSLRDNVRTVCTLGRGVCYGEGPVVEAINGCVDVQAGENRARAIAMGNGCLQIYSDLFACAAMWTCDEYLTFENEPNVPCHDLNLELETDCPGLSPFIDDTTVNSHP